MENRHNYDWNLAGWENFPMMGGKSKPVHAIKHSDYRRKAYTSKAQCDTPRRPIDGTHVGRDHLINYQNVGSCNFKRSKKSSTRYSSVNGWRRPMRHQLFVGRYNVTMSLGVRINLNCE